MNIKNNFFLTFSCLLLVILAGCAHYQARPLNRLVTNAPQTDKPSISFAYHVLSPAECKQYLDRNMIAKGYQPIQITVTNNTNHNLHFSLSNLSIPTVPYVKVAQDVHLSPVKRALGYGIPGLFIWPFLIPAVVDTINAIEANNQLDTDFYFKSLKSQPILPFSTISGLIFVPIEYADAEFNVPIIDTDTKQQYVLSTMHPYATIQ